jgi:hypothetical protein
VGNRVGEWVDTIRSRFATGDTAPSTETGSRFVDGLTYGASQVNPYKPKVSDSFPSIVIPTKRFMPPSMQPHMRIRQGGTPGPTGPTVPQGAIHPKGSK